MRIKFLVISKMHKYCSIEAINPSNPSDQTKFRLYEIIKTEVYFN